MLRDFHNSKGQTLIEVVITLGVALIIIASVLVLVNASNRRATIARQATQGSKLAQQGMEIVRNIRDENKPTVRVGNPGCSVGSPCTWKSLYSDNQPAVKACIFFDTSTSLWNLYPLSHTNCDAEKVGGSLGDIPGEGIFERIIEISDSDIPTGPAQICSNAASSATFADVKRITVTVNWTSPQGAETRTAVGCLANWK